MQILRKSSINDKPKNKNIKQRTLKSVKASKGGKKSLSSLLNSIISKVRLFFKLVLYLAIISFVIYVGWFFYSGKASDKFIEVKNSAVKKLSDFAGRNGLIIKDIEIKGSKYTKDTELYGAIKVSAGMPIFSVDPYEIREKLKTLPWVADAMVVRKMPDQLVIKIVEYSPFAIWIDSYGKRWIINNDGHVVIDTSKLNNDILAKIGKIPVVKGKGANSVARNIIAEVEKYKALSNMITAYEFVDQRRWNLIFDKVVVKLPEIDYEGAIKELNMINKKRNIKNMRVKIIDMRNSEKILFYLEKGASFKFFEKDRGVSRKSKSI